MKFCIKVREERGNTIFTNSTRLFYYAKPSSNWKISRNSDNPFVGGDIVLLVDGRKS